MTPYQIARRPDGRFVINDASGVLLDDAQGYGYKDRQRAEKAAWYKFKGGKAKKDAAKKSRPQDVAFQMFTCGQCHQLLASEAEIAALADAFHNAPDELEQSALYAIKDHICPNQSPARQKRAPIRAHCFRCGQGIREGLPYVLAHLRHNYPDGRTAESAHEMHPSCFERFLADGKGGRSKVVYQVLTREDFA